MLRPCVDFAAVAVLLCLTTFAPSSRAAEAAGADDPYASNFGRYPPAGPEPQPFPGPYKYRALSHDYPAAPPARSWLDVKPKGPITVENAADYMARLKVYVEPSLRKMIEAPADWDPAANGWYDQPWEGFLHPSKKAYIDYEDGRDPILGSFTGQIILKSSESGGLSVDTQNHTVVYYDAMAGSTLHDIWKTVGTPDLPSASYREGSLVVKAGGVAATPEQWKVVDGAAQWRIYRPPVKEAIAHRAGGSTAPYTLTVQDLRVMQFDIIVKDSDAAPKTGWVFTTFIYDSRAPKGTGPWDQLTPLGASWGNDPEYTDAPDGKPPQGQTFKEFWNNPLAPAYANTTLGWGGRMSGPIDIAERHKVVLVDDINPNVVKTDVDCESPSVKHTDVPGPFQASGCFSCHGSSQSSFAGPRMYPSPFPFNLPGGLPSDGQPFCLYTPGTKTWAQWFQDRPGSEAMPSPERRALLAMANSPALAEDAAVVQGLIRYGRPRTQAAALAIPTLRAALAEPVRGLDYDMLLMFAVGDAEKSTKGYTFLPDRTPVH